LPQYARYFIWTDKENPTEEDFRRAGQNDYNRYVISDTFLQGKLKSIRATRALEIGCGIGRVTEFLAQDFTTVYGVDISREMILRAKERLSLPGLVFLEGDGLHLPVPDSAVDFVFSFIVFQHMPSLDVVVSNLKETYRVLGEHGVAKIQVRGAEVDKKAWFYGVSFSPSHIKTVVEEIGFKTMRIEHETNRHLWCLLQK